MGVPRVCNVNFRHKNSYATYAGIGLQVSLVLLWREIKKRPTNIAPDQSIADVWVKKIVQKRRQCDHQEFRPPWCTHLIRITRCITAALIGCFSMLLALATNRRWSLQRWLGILACSLVIIIGFTLFGSDVFIDRLDPNKLAEDTPLRLEAYKTSFAAISANSISGYGLGSFVDAFRLFRDQSIQQCLNMPITTIWKWLWRLVFRPLPSSCLLLVYFFYRALKGVWKRNQSEIYSILAVGVSIQVMLHSLVDFSMQIPAVAATYATLLGIGVAQSWSSRHKT